MQLNSQGTIWAFFVQSLFFVYYLSENDFYGQNHLSDRTLKIPNGSYFFEIDTGRILEDFYNNFEIFYLKQFGNFS